MEIITKYNLKHCGVICRGVRWKEKGNNVFYLEVGDTLFPYRQKGDVSFVSDYDHIKYIIQNQFLPWYEKYIKGV